MTSPSVFHAPHPPALPDPVPPAPPPTPRILSEAFRLRPRIRPVGEGGEGHLKVFLAPGAGEGVAAEVLVQSGPGSSDDCVFEASKHGGDVVQGMMCPGVMSSARRISIIGTGR